jgi:hypothetical protein
MPGKFNTLLIQGGKKGVSSEVMNGKCHICLVVIIYLNFIYHFTSISPFTIDGSRLTVHDSPFTIPSFS